MKYGYLVHVTQLNLGNIPLSETSQSQHSMESDSV